ncbi:MAG: STAS domain-containing protein [Planctomycetes bacterium]|nr:STAS domain-containing protein [Planctomycetota bacterium]
MSHLNIFEVSIENATLIVAPRGDVGMASDEDVHAELPELLSQLQETDVKHVVFDLKKASYFGSVLLGAMSALWGRVRSRGGKLAVCNVSETGLEILQAARFDTVWLICSSREEAIEAVRQ